MKGWKLCILWKNGTMTWEPLHNLKESNPIEVVEYAVANKITDAFTWWIKEVLHHCEHIISSLCSHYWKCTHKFGIQVPKSIEDALQIDKETHTEFWYNAIQKEMIFF